MAIEKMVLLKIIGSPDNMHSMLKELILCENAHLNMNTESNGAYNNYLAVHQYESEIISPGVHSVEDPEEVQLQLRRGKTNFIKNTIIYRRES